MQVGQSVPFFKPLNRSQINKEIQLKYQTIWEPNVKNIQIINMQNKRK